MSAKSLDNAALLVKGVTETVENEVKERKGEFLGMFPATLGVNLLGNVVASKGAVRYNDGLIRAGEGTNRAGQNFLCRLIVIL